MYLGIDFGKARIGLAISETGQLARPLGVIKNKGDARNLAAIKEISTKHNIKYIVCGLPLHADGKETDICKEIRRFGDKLGAVYHNERYSSLEAQEYIRERKLKELVDAVAATMILQSYLEEIK